MHRRVEKVNLYRSAVSDGDSYRFSYWYFELNFSRFHRELISKILVAAQHKTV